MNRKAIYPGTFDPITNGHINLLIRASKIFDKLVLAIFSDPRKKLLFSLEERIQIASKAVREFKNVTVIGFSGLVAVLAKKQKIRIIVRGIRTFTDFEYEKKLAKINQTQFSELETIFLLPEERFTNISSSIIKELAIYGGNIKKFLPNFVAEEVKKKYLKN